MGDVGKSGDELISSFPRFFSSDVGRWVGWVDAEGQVFDFGVLDVGALWSVPCLAFLFLRESTSDVSYGDLVAYVVGVAVAACHGLMVNVAPCVGCGRLLCNGCERS